MFFILRKEKMFRVGFALTSAFVVLLSSYSLLYHSFSLLSEVVDQRLVDLVLDLASQHLGLGIS